MKPVRRQLLQSMGSGLLGAALARSAPGDQTTTLKASQAAVPDLRLLTGRLSTEHAAGRKLSGFIETGIDGGAAFCSLVRQHAGNPAVASVWAEPTREGDLAGVRLTICFYSTPCGSVDFSLLHVGADACVGIIPAK